MPRRPATTAARTPETPLAGELDVRAYSDRAVAVAGWTYAAGRRGHRRLADIDLLNPEFADLVRWHLLQIE